MKLYILAIIFIIIAFCTQDIGTLNLKSNRRYLTIQKLNKSNNKEKNKLLLNDLMDDSFIPDEISVKKLLIETSPKNAFNNLIDKKLEDDLNKHFKIIEEKTNSNYKNIANEVKNVLTKSSKIEKDLDLEEKNSKIIYIIIII